MKKLIFFWLLFLPAVCWSQSGKIFLGAELIPQQVWMHNRSDVEEEELFIYKNTYHFAGGLSFRYFFNDYLGIGSRLLISRQGQKFNSDLAQFHNGVSTITYGNKRLTYIKIPLLLEVKIPLGEKLFITGSIGPQLSILAIAAGPVVPYAPMQGYDLIPAKRNYYNTCLLDFTTSAGVTLILNDKWSLALAPRFDYSFTDAENKNAQYEGYLVYKRFNNNRASTHHITAGVIIGINYKF